MEVREKLKRDPLAWLGRDTIEARSHFEQAFEAQCQGYLQALAEQPPTFKFRTAAARARRSDEPREERNFRLP